MTYCGYITQFGDFIDCSMYPFPKHQTFQDKVCMDEDYMMEELGYVKLTEVVPNDYIYTCAEGLTNCQVKWLEEHGFKVHEEDLYNEIKGISATPQEKPCLYIQGRNVL